MQSDKPIIRVTEVSKTFKLPHEKQNSIKGILLNFYRSKRSFEKQKVLKNVSFDIKQGEFFGIVGRNGSGKSTLLKILAGIYIADKGSIELNGKLTPFIELGVGFNPELTGRDNVFLNGALLGFNHKEMEAMYEDIVSFAELGRFMDQKLKNYSSGMQVRLAFSIAIRAKSDILLIDEVLAVGDTAFQQKCFEVFAELKKAGTTIILVTHDMSAVLRFCDRALLINKGQIVKSGAPAEVADAYLELNYQATEEYQASKNEGERQDMSKPSISSVHIKTKGDGEKHTFASGEELEIVAHFKNPQNTPIHFGFQIFSDAGVYCFATNSRIAGMKPTPDPSGEISVTVSAKLIPGSYYITLATMNDTATAVYNYLSRASEFRIQKNTQLEGVAWLDHSWKVS